MGLRHFFWSNSGQGVAAFTVDDNLTLVGDLYSARLPAHPVPL